jgi:hypothetical protein
VSQQARLFLTSRDIRGLEATFRGCGELRVLAYRSSGPRPSQLLTMTPTGEPDEWLTVFLCRPQDLGKIELREVPEQKYWTVDQMRSPVIEFSRSYHNEGIIRAGRIYFDTAGPAREDADLLKWGVALVKSARRTLAHNVTLSGYVGPEAAQLAAAGSVRLVPM